MRPPDKEWRIPLWEVNHSYDKLVNEEAIDFTAYRLGYEMKEEVDDPTKKAYKYFSKELYPEGNVTNSLDYDPTMHVWLCADFNRSPMAWALMQVHRTRAGQNLYVVFDEIFSKEALTTEQAMLAVEKLNNWGISRVYLAGDNTSNQRSGNYGRTGKNDWDYVREILDQNDIAYKSKLDIQNPRRKVRVDKVNQIILGGRNGERRLLIHERCENVIKDYMYSIVDDLSGVKIDNGDRGHMSDAIDYGIFKNERGSMSPIYALRK